VPSLHASQPPSLLRDRLVLAPPQLVLDLWRLTAGREVLHAEELYELQPALGPDAAGPG
jgi:hypothetical protein